MKIHKALLVALGATAGTLAVAAPAGADPKGEPLTIHCDILGTVEVVVFSNGSPSPGLFVATNQVAIPYQLHVEGTFTPVDGEPVSFTDDFAKPAPRNGRLDQCTFHQEGSDESGSFVLDGAVSISYTPTR